MTDRWAGREIWRRRLACNGGLWNKAEAGRFHLIRGGLRGLSVSFWQSSGARKKSGKARTESSVMVGGMGGGQYVVRCMACSSPTWVGVGCRSAMG